MSNMFFVCLSFFVCLFVVVVVVCFVCLFVCLFLGGREREREKSVQSI